MSEKYKSSSKKMNTAVEENNTGKFPAQRADDIERTIVGDVSDRGKNAICQRID